VIDLIAGQDVEKGLAQVAPIQRWGWYFLGLYSAGSVILFLLSDRGTPPSAEPSAAADGGRDPGFSEFKVLSGRRC